MNDVGLSKIDEGDFALPGMICSNRCLVLVPG
jgi:hypothetical protein